MSRTLERRGSSQPSVNGPLISGEGLVRRYRGRRGREVLALNDVSLEIQPGESVAVVGESGSGKSTLLRCLAALERPDAGVVRWGGDDIWSLEAGQLRRRRRAVQVIFQDALASFNPRLTIGQIVAEPLENYPDERGESRDRRIESLLESVGLTGDLASRLPRQISGGQQQRVAIARALALEPALLLCDEPVSALDVSIQAQIIALLQDLRHRRNLALLFVTHNLSLVPYISERAVIMQRGRIVEETATRSLLAVTHPYSRALLNALPGHHRSSTSITARPVATLAC